MSALHPLIHANARGQYDCMICAQPCDPADPNVYSNQAGLFPTMYFHARPCAVGLSGAALQAVYLREVDRELRRGGPPLVAH